MAILECKMCGGNLILVEGQNIAECESCGTRQTVPTADNEKKLLQFERAGWLRRNFEFDKAAGLYEAIVSEYRRESEAYWGLVLCKYGIEYVDDPATGKKIPTCHRSSYDSVMDDENFTQACEYADSVARKLYREEAKRIEEIRKGIIEVSDKEVPYDIFICYKETDECGDRTLDSVLAQDLYSALTEKGYRVFFSRVTLKGELGSAYEPRIFAALNSAKVMLAIGTDYEHFNAVWVKNEWSRYLQICAKDKSKHLIPCYKGIDAYDMPREFKPLQAVDLGQMGAVQDILFNMEKYIPLKKQQPVIQEKVVVGSVGGNNKVTALLERGNMALEDGDWAKADSFFEDVLNNDARNAQAYIGKTLAQEKCRTMDALVRKRRDVYQNVRSETLYIKPKEAHIAGMAEKYALFGYVDGTAIRNLYDFDLSYVSEVSGRQKQYRDEENWWQNHKQLSRAEKFAVGAVAEHLQSEKKHLFTHLADRVKKAQEADARAVAKLEAAYDAHVAQADKQAEQMYHEGLARREKDYQNWLEQAKRETNPGTLRNLAGQFTLLEDYQDSKNLAEHCRKRAVEEQAKVDAENERQRVIAEQKKKAQQKRNKTIAMISVAVVVLAVSVTMLVTKVIIPGNAYKAAEELLLNGQYEEAIAAFEALGDFKDSADRISECEAAIEAIELAKLEEKYNAAVSLMNEGKYEEAIAAFNSLSGYKDSADMITDSNAAIKELHLKAKYDAAVALEESGKRLEAAIAFGKIKEYKDAWARCFDLWGEITERKTIAAGYYNTVGLRTDGSIITTTRGENHIERWSDIASVSRGCYHTVGLKTDGSVITMGSNDYGQCDVSNWSDIVAIATGGFYTAGLKADGTVIAVGENDDGQCNVSHWTNIVSISAGYSHIVGLKADGTVVAVGYDYYGQCAVSDWTDIVAISAAGRHTVGLKADGTVVAVGDDFAGKLNVSAWKNIVAISAGSNHTVGLKADGTVVATKFAADRKYYSGECDVSNWRDIVDISAKSDSTVGLKADGTAVAVGDEYNGQCNVSDWKNIRLPQ